MGQFYGVNLFLAESSRTTGGLDSLLEPTGNIKKAQDKAARALRRRTVFFGTNGTSTSNKIVVQALLRPGDIVLIDRNCHKSHHYGLVLAGAQPLLPRGLPANAVLDVRRLPLKPIKKALLDLKAEGKLDRASMLDLTNCTFDGHVVQREADDGGVSGDQAGPRLPVGRGLVRLRALLPVPAARTGMGRRGSCAR